MKKLIYIILFITNFMIAQAIPSIYPSSVQMKLDKGHNFSSVTVFNTGDKTMKYKLSIKDVDNLGNSSELAKYLKVFPKFIEIPAGENQIVKIIARGIPANKFKEGESRGSLSIEELESSIEKKYKTKKSIDGVSTTINFKYVINMAIYGYFGNLSPKLEVDNIEIDKTDIKGLITNTGNYSYFIKYQILDKSDKILEENVLFKILYGQKEKFSIKNVKGGVKIKLLEKDQGSILY